MTFCYLGCNSRWGFKFDEHVARLTSSITQALHLLDKGEQDSAVSPAQVSAALQCLCLCKKVENGGIKEMLQADFSFSVGDTLADAAQHPTGSQPQQHTGHSH